MPAPRARTLRTAKWDFWFNGTVVMIYLCLVAWQAWRAVNESAWNWITVVVYLAITAYFVRAAKRAFRDYIEIKERQ